MEMNHHDRRTQLETLVAQLGYTLNVDQTNTDVLTLIDRTTAEMPSNGVSIGLNSYEPIDVSAPINLTECCKPDHIIDRECVKPERFSGNQVYKPDPQHIKLRSPQLLNVSIDWDKMLKMMVCLDCKKIPSPHTRYLCPKGHMFCYECAMIRVRRLDRKCLVEPAHDDEGKGSGNGNNGNVSSCQLEIKWYPSDPIFNALYNSTTWKCPMSDAEKKGLGCDKTLRGSRAADQLAKECSLWKKNKMETTDQIPEIDGNDGRQFGSLRFQM